MDKTALETKPYGHVGVIGAGAWGTALAMAAVQAGRQVTLWARESDVVAAINDCHENERFLAGVRLPAALLATGDLAALSTANTVLIVVPAQHLRETLAALTGHIRPNIPWSCAPRGSSAAAANC